MSARKATVRPIRTEQSEGAERCEQLKGGIQEELRQLHKTTALLIAVQYAANDECEFDVSDALAAILLRFKQHIETLDELCVEASP